MQELEKLRIDQVEATLEEKERALEELRVNYNLHNLIFLKLI